MDRMKVLNVLKVGEAQEGRKEARKQGSKQ
jgi:hypothetical protein